MDIMIVQENNSHLIENVSGGKKKETNDSSISEQRDIEQRNLAATKIQWVWKRFRERSQPTHIEIDLS